MARLANVDLEANRRGATQRGALCRLANVFQPALSVQIFGFEKNMRRGGREKEEEDEEDWPGIKQLRRRQIRQSAERKCPSVLPG